MKETSLNREETALEIRKVAISKRYAKRIVISILCFSVISFAFVAGYMGTFLLFR